MPRIAWAAAALTLSAGCMQGTLATRTGSAGPGAWSTEKTQWAHVGETVELEFLVVRAGTSQPIGNAADYAIWRLGGAHRVTPIDPDGRFRCAHVFTDAPPGGFRECLVEVTAYRTREVQDAIDAGLELVYAANPADLPDAVVASDRLRLRIYRTQVRFDLPSADPPLIWQTAKMLFERHDGGVHQVGRRRPGAPGFDVVIGQDREPTAAVYDPRADQVNSCGNTRVTLLVRDERGREHRFQQIIETP